jgi:cell division protein FtsQ
MSKVMPVVNSAIPTLHLEPRLKFWLGLLGLIFALMMAVALITDSLYNPRLFNINRIMLSGDAAHVDRMRLRQSVVEMIDGNYFSLDSEKIIAALQQLPWVQKARLRRQWPDTLMITIEEHQPIALWGSDKWLTTAGKLVDLPLPKNIVLPKLDGPNHQVDGVWQKYKSWAALFARNGLRLRSMSLSKQHLYTLNLEYTTQRTNSIKGFSMILSESNSNKQLDSFLESRRRALIEYPDLIKVVDLRYPSGFSISHYEPEKLVKTDK